MVHAATNRQFTLPEDDVIGRLEGARLQIEQRFLDGGAVLLTVTEVLAKLVNLLEDIGGSLKEENAAEATARLQGDWDADVAAYDHIVDHILEMADTLADGIVHQFPKRFTK